MQMLYVQTLLFLLAYFPLFVSRLVQTQKGRYKQIESIKEKHNCETKESFKILMLLVMVKTKKIFNASFPLLLCY